MKAVTVQSAGGIETLAFGDLPDPRVQHSHDVLVQIKAAGINPVDTKLRSRGTYYPGHYPAVLGCDGAGVVKAVGDGVSRWRVGDEVYYCHGGIGGEQGSYAQYKIVHEDYLARKPQSLSFPQAAAAPLALITAWESLFHRAGVRAGDEVLVHAGAGGVGHLAVQLAREHGARVCATVSGPAKETFVRDLGAEHCIDYRRQEFAPAVQQWSRQGGVSMALDSVGGATFAQTFAAVRFYGDLVTLLQPDNSVDWKLTRNRNLRVSLELMLSPMFYDLPAEQRRQREILEQATALFDAGRLQVHVARVFALGEAAQAHRAIEQGGVTGKLVLDTSL